MNRSLTRLLLAALLSLFVLACAHPDATGGPTDTDQTLTSRAEPLAPDRPAAVNPAAVNPAAVNPAAVNPAAVNPVIGDESFHCAVAELYACAHGIDKRPIAQKIGHDSVVETDFAALYDWAEANGLFRDDLGLEQPTYHNRPRPIPVNPVKPRDVSPSAAVAGTIVGL
jgi:hypothetical protein